MICGNCGFSFDEPWVSDHCPHDAPYVGLSPAVVDAWQKDNAVHAEAVARDVAGQLTKWRSEIPHVFKTGAEYEALKSHPIDVAVEREETFGPAGESFGVGFTIVVKARLPLPARFKEFVLDKLPDSVSGLTIICELEGKSEHATL